MRGNRYVAWAMAALLMMSNVPAARAQPRAEGIGVHGYWIIDVRNPDGTLASHTEFENELQPAGKIALVKALQGTSMFAWLYVELAGGNAPCQNTFLNVTLPTSCFVVPPGKEITGVLFSGTNQFANLGAAAQTSPNGALVLTGAATASRDGAIDSVRTVAMPQCARTDFIGCDQFSPLSTFTAFSLTPDASHPSVQPIPVTAGQVIQVSVRLSFS
jgi:hypothetical protein